MTTEEQVKRCIGDLVVQIAMLRAENDALREELEAAKMKTAKR